MTLEWMDVLVEKKWLEAEDTYGLRLVAPDGSDLPAFSAGAHINVEIADKLIRQYSLINAPGDRSHYTICILRDAESRGGSKAIAETVREGDTLRISSPGNSFALGMDAPDYLLLAGGIGITPIFGMAEQLLESGKSFEFHYCARSRERAALLDLLESGKYQGRIHFHFDDGPAAQCIDLDAVIAASAPGTHLYVCGPTGMIEAVQAAAGRAGWDPARVHYEAFQPMTQAEEAGGAFQVRLAKSGLELTVPADRSIVDVLEDNGIEVPVSCEQGICGTCLVDVLEGTPDHRDSFLTRREHEANNVMTVCCSRALTPYLVLDL
ncbi:PDR/VanB family oxidoreductase [Henriciella aquimarina]|uniref:PDR/VanB family oxidoreductase n=1 Tax=Henriciella aquimarina TaxID=545261 RepID=UPI0009FBB6B3|nr:PDR/VanB family oxidoreductase [Henriciella aquimarina]